MPRTGQKPTMYDIARISGSSPSTVSSVLNGTWKTRRIREETAQRINAVATAHGYATNTQARGLRNARSGPVGMILPVHDNRFFSSLCQHFATEARIRGLCPVIVSTRREQQEEIRSVESLLSYAIDSYLVHLAPEAFAQTVIGCYDYDPFGAFLQFPVFMVRQNSKDLIRRAYALLDSGVSGPALEMVAPELVPPRTLLAGMLSEGGYWI